MALLAAALPISRRAAIITPGSPLLVLHSQARSKDGALGSAEGVKRADAIGAKRRTSLGEPADGVLPIILARLDFKFFRRLIS